MCLIITCRASLRNTGSPAPADRPPLELLSRSVDQDLQAASSSDRSTRMPLTKAARRSAWRSILDCSGPSTAAPRPSMSSAVGDTTPHLADAVAERRYGCMRGAGSGYLNAVRPGDTVLARVQPCLEAFRIRHDGRTPVIMVAAGTGAGPRPGRHHGPPRSRGEWNPASPGAVLLRLRCSRHGLPACRDVAPPSGRAWSRCGPPSARPGRRPAVRAGPHRSSG